MMKKYIWIILSFFIFVSLLDAQTKGNLSMEKAVFAGGCFWCMQPPFDALKDKGVIKTVVGYTGGDEKDPTYEQVSSGTTGHVEAIEVIYDPQKISYEELLQVYWKNVDPEDQGGQFCDRGSQYKSAIFYANDEQKKLAEASKEDLLHEHQLSAIYTQILPLKVFYPAEEYHQDYYKKNPIRYKFYRYSCGRDKRLNALWGTSS